MYKILSSIGRVNLDDDEAVANGLITFERELMNRGTPFFGGNKPGMLDLMIWPWCERAEILKLFGNANLLKKDKYKRLVSMQHNIYHYIFIKTLYIVRIIYIYVKQPKINKMLKIVILLIQLEWSRRMAEEPNVKRSMMDSDTHIKYLQSYRAGRPDYDMILNSTD